MHPQYDETVDQVLAWSRQDANIEGTLIIGSQVRPEMQADEWSDLDFMIVAHNPPALLDEDGWTGRFGRVVCAFNEVTPLHFTDWDWTAKRILLDDNRDVDFNILPVDRLDEVLQVNRDIIAKGYRVLYDAQGDRLRSKIEALLSDGGPPGPVQPPTEEALRNDLSELLYHIIWAFKKIKRNELWVAVVCINNHIRKLLLRLVEYHNVSITRRSTILMYDGRFLETRTDAAILARLAKCFAKYDRQDAVDALGHLLDTAYFIAKPVFEQNGYPLDEAQFDAIRQLYHAMRATT